MRCSRVIVAARIESARGIVQLAEERALTRAEWDRVAEVRDAVEDSIRRSADVGVAASLGVLAIAPIAEREPRPALAYGIRYAASRSKPGKIHELRRFGARWACSCRGYEKRRTCEHSKVEVQRDRDAETSAVSS